jgi:DNA polymerase-3 subunit alpha
MISRIKKTVTKNGRSAGKSMAIITLEDLEGQIDGTIFAESLEDIVKRHPTAISAESIIFVKGKIDRRRETPGIIVNDVIPVADSVARLTTMIALKLDPLRHADDAIAQLEQILSRHKGNAEVYIQVTTGPGQKVTMRLDRDRFVRPTQQLVDDLELVLGSGSVQLCGIGTRRRKRIEQQRLFKEDQAAEAAEQPAAEASPVMAMDMEMEMAED